MSKILHKNASFVLHIGDTFCLFLVKPSANVDICNFVRKFIANNFTKISIIFSQEIFAKCGNGFFAKQIVLHIGDTFCLFLLKPSANVDICNFVRKFIANNFTKISIIFSQEIFAKCGNGFFAKQILHRHRPEQMKPYFWSLSCFRDALTLLKT
jgi:hypothetical protein